MTNIFGTSVPFVEVLASDTGPLQVCIAVSCAVPSVVTHARYYVADTGLAAQIAGVLPFQVWRDGEPDSTITGTLTIPGAVGWVSEELSTPVQVPAGRTVAVGVSFDPGALTYGATFSELPATSALLTAHGSWYAYQADAMPDTVPIVPTLSGLKRTNYLIDLEVAVSEMISLDPGDLAAADVILVRRNISGTVNTVTPITDALTVNVTVSGGPLDGTDVDVWVPDTTAGLAAADMELQKEIADPVIPSFHQADSGDGGDDSIWSYVGGGVYICVVDGTSFTQGARTTRIATPSLVEFII